LAAVLGSVVLVAAASTGCSRPAREPTSYTETTSGRYYVDGYPGTYYHGDRNYLLNDRWGYPDRGRWIEGTPSSPRVYEPAHPNTGRTFEPANPSVGAPPAPPAQAPLSPGAITPGPSVAPAPAPGPIAPGPRVTPTP